MPLKPIDYSKGVQYKIVCLDSSITDCYNGSCISFKDRKYRHKSTCNNPNSKDYNYKVYQFIREHGGWDNWTMLQLEESPCKNNQELRLREREIFDILRPTLNSYSPTVDRQKKKKNKVDYNATHREEIKKNKAEYYEQNKAELLVKMKEYRAAHKDAISAKQKVKINCECGCVSTKSDLPKHRRTNKHLNLMAQLQ